MGKKIKNSTSPEFYTNMDEILPVVDESQDPQTVIEQKIKALNKFLLHYVTFDKNEGFFIKIPEIFDTIENWERLKDYIKVYSKIAQDRIKAGLDKYHYSAKGEFYLEQDRIFIQEIEKRIDLLKYLGKTSETINQ